MKAIFNIFKLERIFNIYVSSKKFADVPLVHNKKNEIFQTVLYNLSFEKKKSFTTSDLNKFKKELSAIIHGYDDLPNFITQGEQLEEVQSQVISEEEAYDRDARNIFRYILLGTKLVKQTGQDYKESPLARPEIIASLMKQRDPKLLLALRKEFQAIQHNCFKKIQSGEIHPHSPRLKIFNETILAALPFIDPDAKEVLEIPQLIDDQWYLVRYKMTELDISPQHGPLSWLLKEADKLYSYGLEPIDHPKAKSILISAGSTYPAGRAAPISGTYNFYPLHTIGEGHSIKHGIEDWLSIQKQYKGNKSVIAVGHSKGGSCSMVIAAMFPDSIDEAICLDPPALSKPTLNKYQAKWQTLSHAARPKIKVYAQKGSPVFYLGRGFLSGTEIYKVIPEKDEIASNVKLSKWIPDKLNPLIYSILQAYEAHIHHFTARNRSLILKVNTYRENSLLQREFCDDVKTILDFFRFPVQYNEAFFTLLAETEFGKTFKKLSSSNLIAKAIVKVLDSGAQLVNLVSLIGAHVLGIPLGILYSGSTIGIKSVYNHLSSPLFNSGNVVLSESDSVVSNEKSFPNLMSTSLISGKMGSKIELQPTESAERMEYPAKHNNDSVQLQSFIPSDEEDAKGWELRPAATFN